jgi:meso-butanediol dehydrogenase/(S,S)-butanediol dehydrogenase/diacetyl reductase
VLHNNAAGFGFSPFANMTLVLWRHVMTVELDIIFHTSSVAWAHLCDGGGAIINTGSYSALRGIGPLGQVAHAAAKGGVIAMTRSLAVEGARHGVRANSISPGFVSTPSTDAAVDDTGRAWQVNNHLIQRPGKGIDIAHLAVYLASDESSWVTGQNISVDGGATAGWRDDVESDRIVALRAQVTNLGSRRCACASCLRREADDSGGLAPLVAQDSLFPVREGPRPPQMRGRW